MYVYASSISILDFFGGGLPGAWVGCHVRWGLLGHCCRLRVVTAEEALAVKFTAVIAHITEYRLRPFNIPPSRTLFVLRVHVYYLSYTWSRLQVCTSNSSLFHCIIRVVVVPTSSYQMTVYQLSACHTAAVVPPYYTSTLCSKSPTHQLQAAAGVQGSL